jgi:hypothetical protein
MAIYLYENDPLAKGLGLEQVPMPQAQPAALPVSVVGGLPAEMLYPAGTVEFSRLAVYATVLTTVQEAQQFAPALTKWYAGITLSLDPRAGVDLNAFYDRAGLHFYYSQDPVRGKPVYASDSPDVVSHECGHAILDALRPQYWQAPFDEVSAFHESCGDMVAIMTTLCSPRVRAAALQAGIDLHNPVADLAEELGAAIYHTYGSQASSPDYLRSGINSFMYQPPESLPDSAPDSQLSSEPHSFSRVFTGAFYDILVGLYKATATGNAPSDQALIQARQTAGRLLYVAIKNTPPQRNLYRAIATGMLDADRQLFQGDHAELLTNVFSRRRILPIPPAAVMAPGALGGALQVFSLPRGMAPGAVIHTDALQDLTHQAESAAARLSFAGGGAFRVQNILQDDEYAYVQMVSSRPHQIRGEELGLANGVVFELGQHISIQLNRKSGKAVAGGAYEPGEDDVSALQRTVSRLVGKHKIGYRAPTLPLLTVADAACRKQPFYVAEDSRGVKRLYRIYFDCRM